MSVLLWWRKKNIRYAASNAAILGLFLSIPFFYGTLYGAEPDQSTPQKAWESIEAAKAGGNDATVFRCMTPAKQKEVLARTILEAVYWAARFRPSDAQNTAGPLDKHLSALSKTLQEHGIDPLKTIQEYNAWRKQIESERMVREMEGNDFLLERFKGDPSAFYSVVHQLLRHTQETHLEFREEERRKQGMPVVERKKAEPDAFLSARESGDRAIVIFKRMLNPNSVLEIGGQRIRSREDMQLFRKIDDKWYLASETDEPQKIDIVRIEKTQIPYKEPIDLTLGRATYFELAGSEPGKNRIAFWGGGGIGFEIGEKPFTKTAVKYKNHPEGYQTIVGASYIHRDGVTYSGSKREHRFFVAPYKLTLRLIPGQEPVLEIVEATRDELLIGDSRRAHFLKLLESPAKKDRHEAFVGLMELANSDDIGDLKEICDKIRPLTKDADETMAEVALNVLCMFGDEQTLLDVMDDPVRLETMNPFLPGALKQRSRRTATYREKNPLHQGEAVANWNLKQRSRAVKEKAASFFRSADESKYKFAIGYFVRVADRENETVKQAILTAGKHASPEIRAKVVGEFRFYVGTEGAAPMIAEMLQDKDEKVIVEALRAANWCNKYIDGSKITPSLAHPNEEIRKIACYALEGKNDPETTRALLETTHDKNRYVRAYAAKTLGINRAGEAIDRLAEMIRDDPEPDVRKDAVYGLRRFNDENIVPILKEALDKEKSGAVRAVLQESIRRGE